MHKAVIALFLAFLALPWALAAQFQPFAEDGEADNTVDEGSDVYIYGTGFDPNADVSVLVVPDDSYADGQGYAPEASATVRTNSSGILFLQKIWTAVKAGFYDLIADLDGNGRHDGADVVVRGSSPGLTVGNPEARPEDVPEFSALTIPLLAGVGAYLVWRRRP